MTHVIGQHCCADARCVEVCPVDCIHPVPGSAEYFSTDMLFVDPARCIDCGVCADVCPVGAVVPDYDLPPSDQVWIDVNRQHFDGTGPRPAQPRRRPPRPAPGGGVGVQTRGVRVAIIGSGAAGWYTAEHLLSDHRATIEVEMLERLDEQGGLARYGVAPDHPGTRSVLQHFESIANDARLRLRLGVHVGRDVTLAALLQDFDAVICATGAVEDRPSTLPGDDLIGSWGAARLVSWYNGHPELRNATIDLSGEHALVVGNGNVALDVARMLLSAPATVAALDMDPAVRDVLTAAGVRDVTVVGRRGPEHAAFTATELRGVLDHADFDVEVPPSDLAISSSAGELDPVSAEKIELLRSLTPRTGRPRGRTLRLRFGLHPLELVGPDRVRAVRLARDPAWPDRGSEELLAASLVVRAVGFTGVALEGLPFDDTTAIIPTRDGRVIDPATDTPIPRVYATGWISRRPSGTLGHNRECARDTVAAVIEDLGKERGRG